MMNMLSQLHRAALSPVCRLGPLVRQVGQVLRPTLSLAGPVTLPSPSRQSLVTLAAQYTLLQVGSH